MRVFLVIITMTMLLVSCNQSGKTSQSTDTTKEFGNASKPAWTLIGEAYENKNWDLIISIGDTIIGEDDPRNISIFYAEALASKGYIEKAIKVLDKKIIRNPDDYYLYNTKGNVYFLAEKYDSAIYYYDKTTELGPAYARPYINKGKIYEIIGDKQKAIVNYMAAVRLFAANGFINEVQEFSNCILSLDSTNVEARGYLEQIQRE